jgi:hypothetical protein
MDDTAKQVAADDSLLPRPARQRDRTLPVQSLVRALLVVIVGW